MKVIKLPGLIDIHVHLRDPEQTEKEDFYTGTSAALAGGFTTIVDMPNNKTPITTDERLNNKVSIAEKQIVSNIGFYFGSLADNLDEFEKVKDKVLGLKLYLNETTGNFLINRSSLEKIFTAWPSQQPILLHAEDDAVAAVIEIVRKTKKQAHFCHISTSSDLIQIMNAKEEGLPISCGVTPHHLFLKAKDVEKLGPLGRMKPPLRIDSEVQFLWDHLDSIDVIESDHAPHTLAEKKSDKPPYGVPGLETTLPLLLTKVAKGKLKIDDIIRLLCLNPMKILHLQNDEQTYIEVDLDEEYEIKNENLFTKCKWTPFDGWKVQGRVKKVIVSGKTVFENGNLIAKPASAHVVLPHYDQ